MDANDSHCTNIILEINLIFFQLIKVLTKKAHCCKSFQFFFQLEVIGDRFLKTVSSLYIPSLYITVSVKNNKRLYCFYIDFF